MSNADERRAGATILKDLGLFNKAAVFFEERIDPTIRSAVTELVNNWLKRHGWKGDADVCDDFSNLEVWPPNWEQEGEPVASFNLDCRGGVDSNSYAIADLFGVGENDYGLRFVPNYSFFGGKIGWGAFVKGISELVEGVASKGWLHEGKGVFFRPVTLPAELLAPSWESDDWNGALAPLERALDALVADQPVFGKIITKATVKWAPSRT